MAATLKVALSHCTDKEVISKYVASHRDPKIILEFSDYRITISVRQYQSDFGSFYSTLMEIFLHDGEDFVLLYRIGRTGILTYHDLLTKFEMCGNKPSFWASGRTL